MSAACESAKAALLALNVDRVFRKQAQRSVHEALERFTERRVCLAAHSPDHRMESFLDFWRKARAHLSKAGLPVDAPDVELVCRDADAVGPAWRDATDPLRSVVDATGRAKKAIRRALKEAVAAKEHEFQEAKASQVEIFLKSRQLRDSPAAMIVLNGASAESFSPAAARGLPR